MHTYQNLLTVEAACRCGWRRAESVHPADRVAARKLLEWDAHVHETRQRRAYQHDANVTTTLAHA